MSYTTLRLRLEHPLAWVELRRPRVGNRVNLAMSQELHEVVQRLSSEEGIRAVILTGAGKDFSVGYDHPPPSARRSAVLAHRWMELRRPALRLSQLEMPLLAAIKGDALDQGLELALACDLRIASSDSLLGFTELARGLLPWDGGTQRLSRLVGPARALEMLLTGRRVSAQEARGMGLVNIVAEPGELDSVAEDLGSRIASMAPIAVRYLKEAVYQGTAMPLGQGLRLEADLNIILQSTRDREEGIRSFLERRGPTFTGS